MWSGNHKAGLSTDRKFPRTVDQKTVSSRKPPKLVVWHMYVVDSLTKVIE